MDRARPGFRCAPSGLHAADSLGQKIEVLNASTEHDIDAAFAALIERKAHALLLGNDAFFFGQRNRIASQAVRYAIPVICPLRAYATAGGLMSYGTDPTEAYRQQGTYVGRVLKGEKPGELPILQPTKFELVINLKTARTLGLTIPPNLLALADAVIE